MSNIDYYVNRVIEEIKSESVYRQYTTSLEKLNANPEIKRQVDELRRLNYQAQIKNDDIDSYDTIDDIDDKINEFKLYTGSESVFRGRSCALQTPAGYFGKST